MTFSFTITHTDKGARCGIIRTARGDIHTPYFVPVATIASIKSLDSADIEALGAECMLANTYHLYLRPGTKVLEKAGGVCGFMNVQKPLFSDSGGFQAFSLGIGMEHGTGKIGAIKKEKTTQKSFAKVTDKGVHFTSIYDGSKHFMSPKDSMHIQSILGSDIIMAFDECTSPFSDKVYQTLAMKRTHKWAKECITCKDPKQALYGIIQGGQYKDLRIESAQYINSLPFEGIAIGGSFGESVHNMYDVLDWIIPLLDKRPRHLLGIGTVEDIFLGVEKGIDTFDCVTPTRNGRRGSLYLHVKSGGSVKNKFRINIDASQYRDDFSPIDSHCSCPVCQRYTRAYLAHLYRLQELTYYRLASIHNIHFLLTLMQEIRSAIQAKKFESLKKLWLES